MICTAQDVRILTDGDAGESDDEGQNVRSPRLFILAVALREDVDSREDFVLTNRLRTEPM